MKAKVYVKLKKGVLDPQGQAILHAAETLGHKNISAVRVGKVFEIDLDAESQTQAEEQLSKLADTLLANTVIENFQVQILEDI